MSRYDGAVFLPFPHEVEGLALSEYSERHIDFFVPKSEVRHWIEENGAGAWRHCIFKGTYSFELENDALIFKMRWA